MLSNRIHLVRSGGPQPQVGPLRPQATPNAWLQLARYAADEADKRQKALDNAWSFVNVEERSLDPMRDHYRSSGDARVKRIFQDLDSFGITRTSTQKHFHFWFTQSLLPTIYGAEWDSAAVRVLDSFGITQVRTEVMVMTPRRFGKTYSVAMFVVAALLNIPGIKIVIFSTGIHTIVARKDAILTFMSTDREKSVK